MKKLILILLLCSPLAALAQSTQHYLYCIVSIEGNMNKEGIRVKVDDGKEVKKLKDAEGKTIKFNTPAAALMYFMSHGWDLYVNSSTSEGSVTDGNGSSETTSYWIFRKPCTKDEFDQSVENGIRK